MQLLEMHLRNVKSYEKAVVRFRPGLNFISGRNGAGKTTILESIGYVLFDYCPYSVRQFLRYGASSGEIRLHLEALDERTYWIVRRFNRTQSVRWYVVDDETGDALDELHGASDVSRWIRESLGLERGSDLQRVYRQILAVDQGMFTAPFLETPTQRKRIFDEILKVDGYREAFDRTRGLVQLLQRREEALGYEVQGLEPKVEEIPQVEQQLQDVLGAQRKRHQALEDLGRRLEAAQSRTELLDQQQKRVAELTHEAGVLQNSLAFQQKRADGLQEDVKQAETAAQITAANLEGYQRYQKQRERRQELEERAEQRRAVDSQIQGLTSEIAVAKERVVSQRRSLLDSQADAAERRKVARSQHEEASERLKFIEKRRDVCRQRREAWEDAQLAVNAAAAELDTLREAFSELRHLRQQKREFEQDAAAKRETAGEAEQLQAEVEERQRALSLEQALSTAAAVKAQMVALEKNQDSLMRGICPIIQDACPSERVEGGLDRYFVDQMAELQTAQQAAKQDVQYQRAMQREIEELQGKRQSAEAQAAAAREQEAKADQIGTRLVASIQALDLEALKSELQTVRVHCGEAASVGSEYGCAFEFPEAPVLDYEFPTSDPEAWMVTWIAAEEQARCWLRLVGEQFDKGIQCVRYSETQSEQEYAVELHTRKQAEKDILSADDLEARWQKQSKELEAEERLLGRREKKCRELTEKLEGFGDVELELKRCRESMLRDEAAFVQYQSNAQLAQRLGKLQQELAETRKQMDDTQAQLMDKEKQLASLADSYDESEHEALKNQTQELLQTQQREKLQLERLAEQADEFNSRLTELQEAEKAWRQKRHEWTIAAEAVKIGSMVRRVLRDAAEPIAEQYREYLSQMAAGIYREVAREPVWLTWGPGYELEFQDQHDGVTRTRSFRQLSGGEQMTGALAVRLALMRAFAGIGIGFFDEPTTNLDEHRRESLAAAIQHRTQDFGQLFIISHDDAFDAMAESALVLEKDARTGVTKVCDAFDDEAGSAE